MTDEFMDRDRTDSPIDAETPGQRRVREALGALDVQAPDTLRRAVERDVAAAGTRHGVRQRLGPLAGDRSRRPGRRSARPLALAIGGALAALIVALVLVLPGSDSAPTVQEAARVALLPAASPAPSVRAGGDGKLLHASVDGIPYPTWSNVGWRVIGERSDTLAGRRIRTVLYRDARGGRVGYAIAAGDALPLEGGRLVERHGARLWVLTLDGATVVTWRRDGHTCILASREVAPARLVTLAAYAA